VYPCKRMLGGLFCISWVAIIVVVVIVVVVVAVVIVMTIVIIIDDCSNISNSCVPLHEAVCRSLLYQLGSTEGSA
jgi:Na+(H+)/acetate symporter ActP